MGILAHRTDANLRPTRGPDVLRPSRPIPVSPEMPGHPRELVGPSRVRTPRRRRGISCPHRPRRPGYRPRPAGPPAPPKPPARFDLTTLSPRATLPGPRHAMSQRRSG